MKSSTQQATYHYLLYLADTTYIQSHRLTEWCGHGPYLEEDLALTNIALDILGHSQYFYECAAELAGLKPDELISVRGEREYRNLLLVELDKADYAQIMLTVYCFSKIYQDILLCLSNSENDKLKNITKKFLLELANHITHSHRWIQIFSNSTEVGAAKLERAVQKITPYLLEAYRLTSFEKSLIEKNTITNINEKSSTFIRHMGELFEGSKVKFEIQEARQQHGGKNGEHTEFLGYILANVQYLNMKYPNLRW